MSVVKTFRMPREKHDYVMQVVQPPLFSYRQNFLNKDYFDFEVNVKDSNELVQIDDFDEFIQHYGVK